MATAIAGYQGGPLRAAEKAHLYPMQDSSVQVGNSSPPFWLNDTTLFFPGFPSGQGKGPVKALQRSLYLWDIDGRPQRYAVGEWAGEISPAWYCAAKGRVYYLLRSPAGSQQRSNEQKIGAPGKEIVRPSGQWGYEQPSNTGGLPICERNFDAEMAARTWAADSNGEYYLDFGPRRQRELDQTVQLKKMGENFQVDLPLRRSEAGPHCARFFDFSRQFLVWGCLQTSESFSAAWRSSNCLPFWIVDVPTGQTQRHCIPHGPWDGPVTAIVLTRDGILFASERDPRSPPHKDPGAAGLYRLAGGAIQVLPGIINSPVVSPDGCRVALGYGPKFSTLYAGIAGAVTMVVADVCAGKAGRG